MAENAISSKLNNTHLSGRNRNRALPGFIFLVLMGFLLNYVESMVIPSIPALQSTFASSTAVSSWLVSAFLITGTVAAPLFGKLGDKYGKKRMLLVSFIVYSIGVGSAGFANSMGFLIVTRAFQGVGFGGMPLAFAILIDMFPMERVSSAQGIMSGMFATGGVTGLVGGSYIIAYAGWQWAFHSALIVSVFVLTGLFLLLKDNGRTVNEKIDFVGAFSLTLGLTLMLLYVTEASMSGWISLDNLILLVAGVTIIAGFLVHERSAENPLLQLGLMSNRNILVANLIGIFTMAIMQVMFLSLVYFAHDPVPFGKGFSNITTGLVLAPGALVMVGFGPFIGRIISRTGPKPILASGALLLSLGMSVFLLFRSDILWLVFAGIFMWTGMVSIFVPSLNMIAVSLPPERRAIGMGTNMMLRNMGGAIGPAMAASIMTAYSAPLPGSVSGGASLLLPEPLAFNSLMIVGIMLVGIVLLLNIGTRNYSLGKPSMGETPG